MPSTRQFTARPVRRSSIQQSAFSSQRNSTLFDNVNKQNSLEAWRCKGTNSVNISKQQKIIEWQNAARSRKDSQSDMSPIQKMDDSRRFTMPSRAGSVFRANGDFRWAAEQRRNIALRNRIRSSLASSSNACNMRVAKERLQKLYWTNVHKTSSATNRSSVCELNLKTKNYRNKKQFNNLLESLSRDLKRYDKPYLRMPSEVKKKLNYLKEYLQRNERRISSNFKSLSNQMAVVDLNFSVPHLSPFPKNRWVKTAPRRDKFHYPCTLNNSTGPNKSKESVQTSLKSKIHVNRQQKTTSGSKPTLSSPKICSGDTVKVVPDDRLDEIKNSETCKSTSTSALNKPRKLQLHKSSEPQKNEDNSAGASPANSQVNSMPVKQHSSGVKGATSCTETSQKLQKLTMSERNLSGDSIMTKTVKTNSMPQVPLKKISNKQKKSLSLNSLKKRSSSNFSGQKNVERCVHNDSSKQISTGGSNSDVSSLPAILPGSQEMIALLKKRAEKEAQETNERVTKFLESLPKKPSSKRRPAIYWTNAKFEEF